MKKFTIIWSILIALTISTKAQYSNATLNGAWLMYLTPMSPYSDNLMYLFFDGNGSITDWSGFGSCAGSNYSVNSAGAITGTVISLPFVGQLSSQNIGTFSVDGMSYVLSRIPNSGELTGSITGLLKSENCGQKTVTFNIDNQGIITSGTGLGMPVSGEIYADLGMFIGHLNTGDVWGEFSIMGYYSNNTLDGKVVLDSKNCGITSVQLMRQDATRIISINSISTKIEIFPNPAFDIISLNIEKAHNDDLSYNVYNSTGTLVKFGVLKQTQRDIDIKDLCNGIYVVKIKSKGLIEGQKFLIKK